MTECFKNTASFWAWAERVADHAITRFDAAVVELYTADGALLHVYQYIQEIGQICPAGLG